MLKAALLCSAPDGLEQAAASPRWLGFERHWLSWWIAPNGGLCYLSSDRPERLNVGSYWTCWSNRVGSDEIPIFVNPRGEVLPTVVRVQGNILELIAEHLPTLTPAVLPMPAATAQEEHICPSPVWPRPCLMAVLRPKSFSPLLGADPLAEASGQSYSPSFRAPFASERLRCPIVPSLTAR